MGLFWDDETEGERTTRMHNKGQEDAANSENSRALDYDAPSLGITRQGTKDNEDYEKGWVNGKK